MEAVLRGKSKRLSWLLRHGAGQVGLEMDAAGWTTVDGLLRHVQLDRPTLVQIVQTNDKGRIQLHGERIRCCQGHSTEHMPVTQAALEASWQPFVERGVVWHGTTIDVLEAIHTGGLLPFKRTHVHLAPAFDSVVGKRKNRPVMLAISTEKMRSLGVELWRAPNAVVLSRSVPRAAIVGAKPITRRAKRSADAIAALFGRA